MAACTRCGHQVDSGAAFCPRCGNTLSAGQGLFPQDIDAPATDLHTRVRQLETRMSSLEARLPNSNILNRSFLVRVLTIWGYLFVIQLLFGAVVLLLVLFLGVRCAT